MIYDVEMANLFQPLSILEDMDFENTWHFLLDSIRSADEEIIIIIIIRKFILPAPCLILHYKMEHK